MEGAGRAVLAFAVRSTSRVGDPTAGAEDPAGAACPEDTLAPAMIAAIKARGAKGEL